MRQGTSNGIICIPANFTPWQAQKRSPLKCIAAQRRALQRSAANSSAVQCSAVQCSAANSSAVQCSAVQCSVAQQIAVQCNPVPRRAATHLSVCPASTWPSSASAASTDWLEANSIHAMRGLFCPDTRTPVTGPQTLKYSTSIASDS